MAKKTITVRDISQKDPWNTTVRRWFAWGLIQAYPEVMKERDVVEMLELYFGIAIDKNDILKMLRGIPPVKARSEVVNRRSCPRLNDLSLHKKAA